MIEELVAFHLAAAAVTAFRYFRSRDRRLLPLALLFGCLAIGLHLGEWSTVGRIFLYGAGACGLGLLLALTPRARPHAGSPSPLP